MTEEDVPCADMEAAGIGVDKVCSTKAVARIHQAHAGEAKPRDGRNVPSAPVGRRGPAGEADLAML